MRTAKEKEAQETGGHYYSALSTSKTPPEEEGKAMTRLNQLAIPMEQLRTIVRVEVIQKTRCDEGEMGE